MNAAQRNLLKGTNTGLKWRGVSCVIDTVQPPVTVLVQVVDEKARKGFAIADNEITHVLHILRSDASSIPLQPRQFAVIARQDSPQTYRVQYIKDDPQSLKILFFCVAAAPSPILLASGNSQGVTFATNFTSSTDAFETQYSNDLVHWTTDNSGVNIVVNSPFTPTPATYYRGIVVDGTYGTITSNVITQ